jgi:uncharacterized protein (TIGR00725 family)
MLAEAGYIVATGGYIGTMEAASRGALEAGGHVIGVTCDQLEEFRPLAPNSWVIQVIRYRTLRERLVHLVTENEGMIVLPGGIGTLSEMALAWSLLQVGEISPRPLVLLGSLWRETMTTFIRTSYVHADHAALFRYADHPAEAVGLLNAIVRSNL